MLITQLIKALIIIYLFTFFIYLFTFLLSLRTSIIQLPSQTVPPTQCTDTQRNPQKAPYRVIRTDDDSILHLWICSRVVICISRIAHLREFLSKVKTWIQLLINRNTCTFFFVSLACFRYRRSTVIHPTRLTMHERHAKLSFMCSSHWGSCCVNVVPHYFQLQVKKIVMINECHLLIKLSLLKCHHFGNGVQIHICQTLLKIWQEVETVLWIKKKKERKKHLDVPTNVFAVAFCVFAFWLKGFNLCMVKCESMHSLFYFMSSNYIQHNGGCRRKKNTVLIVCLRKHGCLKRSLHYYQLIGFSLHLSEWSPAV